MATDEPNESTRRLIDESLRKVFGEQASAELPDRFRDLLDELRKREQDPQE